MNNDTVINEQQFFSQQLCVMPTTPRPQFVMVRGEGHYLFDNLGRKYLDFIQGWAVNCLGHSPSLIKETLVQQADMLINPGPAFYNQPMLELAQLLCANSIFEEAYFASSGAEANEGAIKLARKWGAKYKAGAYKIITFDKAFHGRTLATMSACGKAAFDTLFEPKVGGFTRVPYNDPGAVKEAVDEQTVAIMLELVQGEGGVIPADLTFVSELQTLCRDANVLLIVDEVQTGIGRTGALFAYEHYGIEPDVITLGKGLGGGVPISAMLCKKRVSCFDYGDQGGTYNGNPLMCAVAVAVVTRVIDILKENSSFRASVYLESELNSLSREFNLGKIRGRGLLQAMDIANFSAPALVHAAMEKGLLLNAPSDDTLRFMPALTVGKAEIDLMIGILKDVLGDSCNNQGRRW